MHSSAHTHVALPLPGARMPTCTLFYDVISPYTHLALHTWSRYTTKNLWKTNLVLRPMFLGGVMKATGNKPPAVLKQKGAFMAQDLRRSSLQADVPLLETPSNFFTEVARAVLQVQRTLSAAEVHGFSQERQLEVCCFCHRILSQGPRRKPQPASCSIPLRSNLPFALFCRSWRLASRTRSTRSHRYAPPTTISPSTQPYSTPPLHAPASPMPRQRRWWRAQLRTRPSCSSQRIPTRPCRAARLVHRRSL